MTGIGVKVTESKKRRIKHLTEEGLSTAIIARRLHMHVSQVIYWQKRLDAWKGGK